VGEHDQVQHQGGSHASRGEGAKGEAHPPRHGDKRGGSGTLRNPQNNRATPMTRQGEEGAGDWGGEGGAAAREDHRRQLSKTKSQGPPVPREQVRYQDSEHESGTAEMEDARRSDEDMDKHQVGNSSRKRKREATRNTHSESDEMNPVLIHMKKEGIRREKEREVNL
jgi:hypothetical protein